MIKAWDAKINNRVWLWTYTCKSGKLNIPGIPCSTPRAVGEYYKQVSGDVFGVMAESNMDSDAWLTGYLNYYVFAKIMWDAGTDVESLLGEHYKLMYGQGAAPMREIFETFEKIWLEKFTRNIVNSSIGPVTTPPADHEIWTEIYSGEVLDKLEKDYDRAAALAENKVEKERIELMRRTFLAPLNACRHEYMQRTDSVGKLRLQAGETLFLNVLNPGKNRKNLNTRVTAEIAGHDLVVKFVCDEPFPAKMAAEKHPHDFPKLYTENNVEIFLNPSGDRINYYQLIVNSRGSLTDQKMVRVGSIAQPDISWNSNAAVKIASNKASWTAEVSIPLKSMPDFTGNAMPVNFSRKRVVPGSNEYNDLYHWGVLAGVFHDIAFWGTLELKPSPPEASLIQDGDFTDKLRRLPENAAIDRDIFVNTGASLRLNTDKEPVFVQRTLNLKPDTTYRLSGFVRLDNITALSKGGGVCFNISDGAKQQWFPAGRFLTGTIPWTYMEYEFTTPKEIVKTTYLRLRILNVSGTAWFDKVRLVENK